MKKKAKSNKNLYNNILTIIMCALAIICVPITVFLSNYDWHNSMPGGLSPVGAELEISGNVSQANRAEDWDYFDDAVMVGDSITYGMASYGYLTFDHVFAKIGLHQSTALSTKCVYTSKTTSYKIEDAVKMAKPGKIFITLGINAIYNYKSDSFYDDYRKVIKRIKEASPESVIIVQSIFPVTEHWAIQNNKPFCNEYIAYANKQLSVLAKEEDCYYLHTYEALTDVNGFLLSEYSGDGIHLSSKGYDKVFNYILTHPIKSSGKFTKIGAIRPPVVYTSSQVSMPQFSINSGISQNESSKTELNQSSISTSEQTNEDLTSSEQEKTSSMQSSSLDISSEN